MVVIDDDKEGRGLSPGWVFHFDGADVRGFLLSSLVAIGSAASVPTGAASQVRREETSQYTLLAVEGMDKPVGDYQPHTKREVSLSGSRREVVSFLLKVAGDGCSTFRTRRFRSTSGEVVSFPSRFYLLDTISTTNPSFTGAHVGEHFDPVIPLKGGRFCGDSRAEKWVVAELHIPRSRAPGRYKGHVTFGGDSLDVEIVVWPMRMPTQIRLPMYAEMSPFSNLIGHFGKWTPVESYLAKKYNRLLQRHHVYSLKSSIVYPRVQRVAGRPRIDIHSSPSTNDAFYPTVVKNRDKSAYYDFPSTALSNLTDAEEIDYYRALEDAAREIGRPGRAMLYLWDEPYEPVYPRLLELLQRVKRYAPSVKAMVTVPAYDIFRPYIDIFCPVMNHFDEPGFPSPSVYQELQRQGKEVWWYVSCMSHGCEALQDNKVPDMVVERPSAWVRSIGWLSAKYSIDAFLYYMVNVAYNRYPTRDPWESMWEFSGNGDGTLLYPGRAGERGFKKHRPIASLRLKLWREASFDAQYVHWMQSLKRRPRWFDRKLDRLVKSPQRWSPNYTSYSRFRSKIGSYLARYGGQSRRQSKS